MLVVDTNILLSSLSLLAAVIKKVLWTIVMPMSVIMELDGLSSNTFKLGEAGRAMMAFVSSGIRSYSTSLKVQT
jgi:predicted ribonuclease YlaK